jgi:hypothetical protein
LEKLFSANHTLRFNINVTVGLYFSQIDHAFKQVYLNVLIMSTFLKRDCKLNSRRKHKNGTTPFSSTQERAWVRRRSVKLTCIVEKMASKNGGSGMKLSVLLVLISVHLTTPTYIFVRGLGGSGTSLAARLFQNHESVTGLKNNIEGQHAQNTFYILRDRTPSLCGSSDLVFCKVSISLLYKMYIYKWWF